MNSTTARRIVRTVAILNEANFIWNVLHFSRQRTPGRCVRGRYVFEMAEFEITIGSLGAFCSTLVS